MHVTTSATPTPRARREARRTIGPLVVSLVVHGLVLAAGGWWSSRVTPEVPQAHGVSLSFAFRDESLDVPFDTLDDVSVDARPPVPPIPPIEALPEPPLDPPLDSLPDVPQEGPTSIEPDPAPTFDETPLDFATPPPPLSPSAATRPAPAIPPLAVPAPAIPPPEVPPAAPTPTTPRPRPPLVEHVAPRPPALPGGASGATYVVTIEYAIAADGRVAEATVTSGSGWPALDEATRAFVLAHWRYAPPGEPRRASRRFLFRYGG